MTRQIVLNKVKCKVCNEELISRHRHDYKTCNCDQKTMVDGGLDYFRYGGKNLNLVDTSLVVYLDDDYELVRNSFCWGTYGINGDEPLKWIELSKINNDHLDNILKLFDNKENWIKNLFLKEKNYRNVNS